MPLKKRYSRREKKNATSIVGDLVVLDFLLWAVIGVLWTSFSQQSSKRSKVIKGVFLDDWKSLVNCCVQIVSIQQGVKLSQESVQEDVQEVNVKGMLRNTARTAIRALAFAAWLCVEGSQHTAIGGERERNETESEDEGGAMMLATQTRVEPDFSYLFTALSTAIKAEDVASLWQSLAEGSPQRNTATLQSSIEQARSDTVAAIASSSMVEASPDNEENMLPWRLLDTLYCSNALFALLFSGDGELSLVRVTRLSAFSLLLRAALSALTLSSDLVLSSKQLAEDGSNEVGTVDAILVFHEALRFVYNVSLFVARQLDYTRLPFCERERMVEGVDDFVSDVEDVLSFPFAKSLSLFSTPPPILLLFRTFFLYFTVFQKQKEERSGDGQKDSKSCVAASLSGLLLSIEKSSILCSQNDDVRELSAVGSALRNFV